jgi:hypothetical protein
MPLATDRNRRTAADRSALFLDVVTELLSRGCHVRFRAEGTSMQPAIRHEDYITVAPVNPRQLAAGDVVLFEHQRGATAHRIVAVRQQARDGAMWTRGDNAEAHDGKSSTTDVLGRVVSVTRNGFERSMRRSVIAPAVRRFVGQLAQFPMSAPVRVAAGMLLAIAFATSANAQVVSGTYTGDGTDNRAIVSTAAGVTPDALGFTPDVVIVKAETAQTGVIKTSTMAGDASKPMTGASAIGANMIQAIVSGGFQVGTDARVNQTGTVYHFVAFKATPGKLKVGTYTGNGVNNRTISGVGFSSDVVIMISAGATEPVFGVSDGSLGAGVPFDNSAGGAYSTAVSDDGFTFGNALPENNTNGVTYHYVAWNEVGGQMAIGSFTGNGADNRVINGFGFKPEYVIVKQTGQHAVQHMASMGDTTDQSLFFDAQAQATNRIQELQADGIELGNNFDVNENGVTTAYIAFGRQLELESRVVSGTYTGNGADNRVIAGLTFTPEFVIVKGNNAQVGVLRSITMTGDETKPATGATAVAANLIQEIRESSFVIGNDARVNSNGVVYQWVAFRSGPGEMQVGAYVGTGVDNRSITGLGFQPDLVIVMPDGGTEAVERSSTIAGDSTYDLGSGTTTTNQIQSFLADGFQVGTNNSVNTNGATYHYVAWKAVAGKTAVGTYNGNSTDNRAITGLGFQPELVMVRRAGGSTMAYHPASLGAATDSSQQFLAGANSNNWIQALQADGFQVGTNTTVNATGSAYHWIAWKQPAVTAVRFRTATATLLDDGRRMIDWHTAFEVNNLGFNVYRGEGKERVLLTPVPVAGSALMLGPKVKSLGDFSYRWIDSDKAPADSQYWIEDIDLSGATSMYGPLRAEAPRKNDGKKGDDKGRDKDDSSRGNGPAIYADLAVSPLLGGAKAAAAVAARAATQATVASAQAASGSAKGGVVSPGSTPVASSPATAPAVSTPTAPPVEQAKVVEMIGKRLSPSEKLEYLRWLLGMRRDRTVSPEMRAQWKVAGRAAAKVAVRTAGWYRVTASQLIAAGIDAATDPRSLQLFFGGVEQAMVVNGADDRHLDAQDSIEFYAEGADTPYSDAHVYWIVAGNGRGERVIGVAAGGSGSTPRSFAYTAESKPRTIYATAVLNGEDENFFGDVVTGGFPTDVLLDVADRDATAGTTARLEVQLQGLTDDDPNPDHTVSVMLNGHAVGVMTFDGTDLGLGAWDVDPAWLVDGSNTVSLEGVSEFNVSLVDRIRLTYNRLYRPVNNRLRMVASGYQPVSIGPFTTSDIRVIDITDAARAVELAGTVAPVAGGFEVRVQPPAAGLRTLVAFTNGAIASASPEANQVSTWNKEGQSADVVIISHAAFIPELDPLKRLREAQGYRVAVVDVQDVYDEFSFGEKTPFALKRFLIRAQQAWRTPPRFVLLVGNATNDPRDYYGFGEPDFVPTKLAEISGIETASDEWFADLDDDGIAESGIIGRLPVRTAAEAHDVVAKIVGYEEADALAWSKSVLLVADTPDPNGFNFQDAVSQLLPLVPSDYTVNALGVSTPASNADVMANWNSGQAIVNFVGHGSQELWGSSLLERADAAALTNGSRLPFVVAMNCLNGFFQGLYPEESLAESLVRAPNGGAVAVWASSALTSPAWQAAMNRELFKKMFDGTTHTAGEAVAAAKRIVGDPDVSRSWIFFGDPVTRLKGMPQVDPSAISSSSNSGTAGSSDNETGRGSTTDENSSMTDRPQAEPRRLVDFNGDGFDDALLHELAGGWRIGLARDGGIEVGGQEGSLLGDAYPADLNGDGRMDVFWYNASTGAWAQAINGRTGKFAVTRGTWAPGWTVRIGDFDGNGRADVFLYDVESGIWFQCLSDGTGGFVDRTGTTLTPGRPYVVDFNRDGYSDVFVHDLKTGRWTSAVNSGYGTFSTTSDTWDLAWSVMPGDLDGDGRTDLVLWNAQSTSWIEALTRPSGGFVYRASTRATGGQPHLADLNGDGREDVLWHDARLGRWSLRLSKPSGTFAWYQGTWEAGWDVLTGKLDTIAGVDLLLYNPDNGSWRRVSLAANGLQATKSGSWDRTWTVAGARR